MKMKKSTALPLALLAYLAGMAYIGRGYYYEGKYLYYFGIITATIIIIVLLHLSLKRKERLRREREEDMKESEKTKK